MWLLASMLIQASMWFPSRFLDGALDQFLNLRQSLRGQVTGFDQVQHQTIGRTSKKAVKHFADRLRNGLLAAENGAVNVRALLKLALDLTLAVQHIQHGLHGGIG